MLIGICGGIGSGKSVVSRLLRELGYRVIDCDMEAKRLMAESTAIKSAIRDCISEEVTDGESVPDRRKLAEIVFSDEEARIKLNKIVHGALLKRIAEISEEMVGETLFAEAAILAESGLAGRCDKIWRVVAGKQERIVRVSKRDCVSYEQVEARIRAQAKEEEMLKAYADKVVLINNTDNDSLMQQIIKILSSHKN